MANKFCKYLILNGISMWLQLPIEMDSSGDTNKDKSIFLHSFADIIAIRTLNVQPLKMIGRALLLL